MSGYTEYLAEGFTPNPYFDKMLGLCTEEMLALISEIRAQAAEQDFGPYGNDIPSSLVDSLIDQFGSKIDDVIDTFEATDLVPANMPPAPMPLTLYGRFGYQQPLLDIGSGDGRKAERAKVADLVMSEKDTIPNGRFSRQFKLLDAEDAEQLRRLSDGRVLSSFMALSQIRDIEPVLSYDGLHVVPDTEHLKIMGAVDLGDSYEVSTRTKKYRDFKHTYPSRHLITTGYVGVVSYSDETERGNWIELERAKPFRTRPLETPTVESVKFNTDPEATPKYDGIQVDFHLKSDGTGVAMNRAGQARLLKHSFKHNLRFITESVNNHYILTRVISYRGFTPFHTLSALELFVKKKRVDIFGETLLGPASAKHLKLPTDGLIMRRMEIDYRVKGYVGVDLDSQTWLKYMAKFRDLSEDWHIDEEPVGRDIVEYSYQLEQGVHHFTKLRHRNDKLVTTDIDTFRFLNNVNSNQQM